MLLSWRTPVLRSIQKYVLHRDNSCTVPRSGKNKSVPDLKMEGGQSRQKTGYRLWLLQANLFHPLRHRGQEQIFLRSGRIPSSLRKCRVEERLPPLFQWPVRLPRIHTSAGKEKPFQFRRRRKTEPEDRSADIWLPLCTVRYKNLNSGNSRWLFENLFSFHRFGIYAETRPCRRIRRFPGWPGLRVQHFFYEKSIQGGSWPWWPALLLPTHSDTDWLS